MMRLIPVSIVAIVLLPCRCRAGIPSTQIGPPKFKMWFYRWEHDQLPKSDNWARCLPDLELYWSRESNDFTQCNAALNCILRETDEVPKQMLAASMVLLGLMPGILALMAPSIAESAMLSLDHPLLSFLLAFGASGVFVPRLWDYSDPLDTIKATRQPCEATVFSSLAALLRPYRRLIVTIEYITGLTAVANVIQVSLDLGWRSVSSWYCDSSADPEVRDLLLRTGAEAYARRKEHTVPTQPQYEAVSTLDGRITLYTKRTSLWTVALQNVASGCVIGHLMYAAIVFSSLMFLTVTDATVVILRYAVSAAVCRSISRYELAVMSQKYRVECVEAMEEKARVYVWTWRTR
ncbi:hypothetical protein F5Y06DRAFT_306661 [Hypoxylon sp. FL0890]|nr:hypothetical protein F5Y06DRAFT_306661 [Hypoxylon sp. FL0890]